MMVAKEGLVWDSTNLAFHAEAALRLGTTFSINSCVLVQAAITEYRTLGGLSKRALFSYSSGGWKSTIKVPADLVPGRGLSS